MPVVYIDVLLGVNLFVNYFLLLAVGRFLHLAVRRLRLLTGAAVGAAFSLSILLPPLPAVLPLLFRLALSLLLILISFPIPTGKRLVQAVLAFYLVSFAFAGFFLALWLLTSAEGIFVRNSIVYFDLSPLVFLLSSVLAYAVVRLLQRITGREEPPALTCRVEVRRGSARAVFTARVDTGNSLTEPFSGAPVIVAEKKRGRRTEPLPGGRLPPGTLSHCFRRRPSACFSARFPCDFLRRPGVSACRSIHSGERTPPFRRRIQCTAEPGAAGVSALPSRA